VPLEQTFHKMVASGPKIVFQSMDKCWRRLNLTGHARGNTATLGMGSSLGWAGASTTPSWRRSGCLTSQTSDRADVSSAASGPSGG